MGARGRFARFAKVRRKPDANQAEIVKALRRCGASVLDLSSVGDGCPDLIAGYRGVTYLIEIKTMHGVLRESQSDFIAMWHGAPVVVVRSEAEAMCAIGIRLDT